MLARCGAARYKKVMSLELLPFLERVSGWRGVLIALIVLVGPALVTPEVIAGADETAGAAGGGREPHTQSPIDLPAEPPDGDDDGHRIEIHYVDSAEHLIHREHTIEVEYDPGSAIAFDGASYALEQMHFHTPSEHLVVHERFPVELHLVHRSEEGGLLVLGILFDVGPPSSFVERILRDAPRDVGRIDLDRHLNAMRLFPKETHFYTYLGSLTTPPYTEGVRWLILTEHPTVSPAQVVRLLVLEGGNARDVQPLNARRLDGL